MRAQVWNGPENNRPARLRPILAACRRVLGRRRTVEACVVEALDGLPHGFCLFDAEDRLVFANAGFRRMYDQPVERAPPGMHCLAMITESVAHGLYAGRDAAAIWTERKAFIARRTAGTFLQSFADGRLIAIAHQPQNGGWSAVYEDVTERRRAETMLQFMAHHDPLTGLPNRFRFAERLDDAMAALGSGGSCALLCLDLDGFKPVNDRYGHAVGDVLLQQVAERLQAGLREADFAARLGGDEFAVLLGDTSAEGAYTYAERLRTTVAAPYDLGAGQPIRIGTGIGIACAPEHASASQSLVERADAALYEAKRQGGPCLWSEGLGFGGVSGRARA